MVLPPVLCAVGELRSAVFSGFVVAAMLVHSTFIVFKYIYEYGRNFPWRAGCALRSRAVILPRHASDTGYAYSWLGTTGKAVVEVVYH